MKAVKVLKSIILFNAIFTLGGCMIITPEVKDFDPEAEVTTIETPNTSVLSCLGDMIDASPQNPVYINVHRLRDETIPEYFRERGLTNGGMWLATTAISRLNTDKVVAVLARYSNDDLLPDDITRVDFRGAFTQFDRLGVTGSANVRATFRKFGFDFGLSEEYELITGDFTTSINGRVLNSTAVGIIVLTNSGAGTLLWNDGGKSGRVQLRGRMREGRQNAQRHIIEAATVLHIASYFGLDYKECLEKDERYITQARTE